MHVIFQTALEGFWNVHPDAQAPLRVWYKRVEKTNFTNLVELQQVFPSADLVGNFVVFNIGGNEYRLIAYVDFEFQKVFIRHVLTHAEYDKEKWKRNDRWFKR
jgi:mRNA interferase HigB